MTTESKRRRFPELAKLLSKEPGWADEESALQGILAAFLRGQLSGVTCPREDVGLGEGMVHMVAIPIPGPDPNPAPLPDPIYIPDRLIEGETPLRHKYVPTLSPPQQPFTRDDWREGFRAFGGQGQNVEVISFEALAELPISVFPPNFRQAYIDWLYTTDAEIARWLRGQGAPVPGWLRAGDEPERLGREHQRKGGQASKIYRGVQKFVDRLCNEFEGEGKSLTLGRLVSWLTQNAPINDGYEPEPVIPDFGDVEYNEEILMWKDDRARPRSLKKRSLEPYIARAKSRYRGSPS